MTIDPIIRTEQTRIKRLPERDATDWETVTAILDEGFVCHVGFTGADGRPYVIPTAYGRIDDVLVLHGSPASRMLRTLAGGVDVCVTVTLLDGLVLARSTVHHSINYRSVVVLGRATEVTDPAEKAAALEAFVEHVVPGRTAEARAANDGDLKRTKVLRLPLREVSAKTRTGPSKEEPEDLDLPVWAGVVPLSLRAGRAEADGAGVGGLARPPYVVSDAPARARVC